MWSSLICTNEMCAGSPGLIAAKAERLLQFFTVRRNHSRLQQQTFGADGKCRARVNHLCFKIADDFITSLVRILRVGGNRLRNWLWRRFAGLSRRSLRSGSLRRRRCCRALGSAPAWKRLLARDLALERKETRAGRNTGKKTGGHFSRTRHIHTPTTCLHYICDEAGGWGLPQAGKNTGREARELRGFKGINTSKPRLHALGPRFCAAGTWL